MKDNTKAHRRPFAGIHFTSTFSMSLVLFLVGLVCMLIFVARDMSTFVRENINLSVILDDQISPEGTQRIERYLKSTDFAKSVTYISKDEALKDHIASMGEDPQKFLGYNPLMASIEVKLNAQYANSDSVTVIESKIKRFQNINRVAYQKDMVSLVNENIKKLSLILVALAISLLFISVALINNTIRLTIYSNRFLINTMRLVGATSWFIRKPYVGKSMLNGLLAAFLAILMLVGLILYIRFEFGMTGMMIQPISAAIVVFIVVFIGLLLSAISSYFAVGRFLKMNTNDMYFA